MEGGYREGGRDGGRREGDGGREGVEGGRGGEGGREGWGRERREKERVKKGPH